MEAAIKIDSNSEVSPVEYLRSCMFLGLLPKCIHAVVELDIANNITAEQSVNVEDLARRLKLDATNLRRLLGLLASHGIFKQLDSDNFIGNQLSQLLRDDTSNNFASMVRHLSQRECQLALLDLDVSLKTGQPSFEQANGVPFYKFLTKHPEAEQRFDFAIADFSGDMQANLVQQYDFSVYSNIVDIGGGRGALLEKILLKNDNINAILFERAAIIPNIVHSLHSPPLHERFKVIAGDALGSVDVEADLFIIANMLLDFSDEDVTTIVTNVAKAMARSKKDNEAGRLLIIEPDIANYAPNEPSLVRRGLDLLMMYVLGGKGRTTQTWQLLLEKCGIKVNKIFQIPPLSLAFECQLE